jgi:hypothetical protein
MNILNVNWLIFSRLQIFNFLIISHTFLKFINHEKIIVSTNHRPMPFF